MQKIVNLNLEGNLQVGGFQCTLQTWEDEPGSSLSSIGSLPANPRLADCLLHWRESYRSITSPDRLLKARRIKMVNSLEQQIEECKKSASQLQKQLNTWLSCETFSTIDNKLKKLVESHLSIRLLIGSNDFSVHQLPWELWNCIHTYRNVEFAFGRMQLKKPEKASLTFFKRRVKILVVLGSSDGIDIEADRQLMNNFPNAEITVLVETSAEELKTILWKTSWDIIFFAGHSETAGDTGRIYANNREKLLVQRESMLWYSFKQAVERGLQLAIFNSCDGLGIARQLEELQVPQVIVMRDMVPDKVARTFLGHFLKSFAEGYSLACSVRKAREELQDLEDEFPCASWLPVMFQS